jgi:hypothetical protein
MNRVASLAVIAAMALAACSSAAAPTPQIVYVTVPTPVIIYVTPAPSIEAVASGVGYSPAVGPSVQTATLSPDAATPSGSPERVAVATAACPNPYGPLPGEGTPPPIPAEVVLPVPSAWAKFFNAYASNGGWVLAPRGWLCQDLNGGGSGSTTQVAPIDDPNARVSVGYQFSHGGSIFTAAPYFASAAKLAKQDPSFGKIPTPPPGETWYALAREAVFFRDDAGVKGAGDGSGGPYLAQGVIVYRGSSDLVEITCVLPDSQSALCGMVLNNFLDQEGVKARV